MNAVILHGKPSKQEYMDPALPNESNRNWLPWLQKQLIIHGIKADTPELPKAYDPEWREWEREVERFDITPDTLLIGHSCGAGFWVKYLSLHKDLKVGKVILVAPWMDPDGDATKGFFEGFEIDPNLASRTKGIKILHSDNDMGNVHKTVALLRDGIKGIAYQEFHKYGHFCYEDMASNEFPALLQAALEN